MKRLITLTGISLLVNRLEWEYLDKNKYPQAFLDCLDPAMYNTLKAWEQKVARNLLPLLRREQVDKLAAFLAITCHTPDLIALSAETKTIELILIEEQIGSAGAEIVFLASNTTECIACAKALAQFYEYHRYAVSIKTLEKLSSDLQQFEQGIKELTDVIVELSGRSDKISEVLINATAGYKPESSYATVCGLLTGLKIYYGHEQFNRVVRLPAMPIGVDFSQLHTHASKIILALEENIESAYLELPSLLQETIIHQTKTGNFELTYAGSILWQKYLDSRSEFNIPGSKWLLTEKLRNKTLRDKIINYIRAWDHIWVGMQVPQMVDHTQAHCQNILGLGEQLLVQLPSDFINQAEVYLLIAGIWLHDIGHSEPVIIEKDDSVRWLKPSEIRKLHHLLSYQRIKYDPKYFGFDEFNEEAELIALLCKYHNTLDINRDELSGKKMLYGKEIRLKLLIGLLRLLDASDIGLKRVGDIPYRLVREKITEKEIAKYEQLTNLTKDSEARKLFEDEVNFRKMQKAHFHAHAKIDGTVIKVTENGGKYCINVVFQPVEGVQNVLETIKEVINLDKLEGAAKIIKEQASGVIKDVTFIESNKSMKGSG